jgi:hypothetical protein
MTLVTLPSGAQVDVPEREVAVHEHLAQHRTIERWKYKDAYRALRGSYMPEVQELESALWQVWVSKFLEYATGESLDMLGRIVDERRAGASDPN